jgi:prolyl-tRNA synthetase
MVTGGNERDVHVVNVNFGRDVSVDEFADLRSAQAGDSCPRCHKLLSTTRGIEVGHIFKLGTKYSTAMNCTYLDREGRAQPMIMGCYGIGVGRTVAAAIEQSHDENGIIFPESIAPFSVIVVPVNTNDAAQMEIALNLYNGLAAKGVEVLLDDRDERPGSKFKDADLIGIPLRVTVGKNAVEKKCVDIKERKGGEAQQVATDDAVAVIARRLKQPEV